MISIRGNLSHDGFELIHNGLLNPKSMQGLIHINGLRVDEQGCLGSGVPPWEFPCHGMSMEIPMGRPVGRPMGIPMGCPMGRPMGRPMGIPMERPIGRPWDARSPMGIRMGRPMGCPMGYPMGCPIGRPMGILMG